MSYRYPIIGPATTTERMGPDYIGGMVFIRFFDEVGLSVEPVGEPLVYRSHHAIWDHWHPVEPFNRGEWRFNAYAQRVKIDLSGVTGYATYKADVYRSHDAISMIPDGSFTGIRAICTQPYDEMNKKRGAQWEASRLITIADDTPASNAYSIIQTGSLTVDLKARVFGYTGLGVIGRIYKNPTYSGGTNDPWYNMRTGADGQPLTKLLTGFTLTNSGTKCGADIFAIGPESNQARGHSPSEFARNRILEPNTAYLLEIQSRDPAQQVVTARLEMYEGILDWPINP